MAARAWGVATLLDVSRRWLPGVRRTRERRKVTGVGSAAVKRTGVAEGGLKERLGRWDSRTMVAMMV